jgi:hypothetical protein
MCRYKYLFIAQLFALTIISLSSCDFIDRILDNDKSANQYDGSSQYNNEYSDSVQNNSKSQADADNSESNPVPSQSNQEDIVSEPPAIPVQSVIVENNQNKQDSIIDELNYKIGYLESKNARMIESSTVFTLMLLYLLLLIMLFLYLYSKINASKSRYGNSSNDKSNGEGTITPNKVNLLISNKIEEHVKEINNKIKKQDETILEFDKRLKKLEREREPYTSYYAGVKHEESQGSPSASYTPVYSSSESQNSLSSPKMFYMPRTMTKLQFDDSKKKWSRSENTYFKFILEKDNQATFMFDPFDENCIKKAFDDRDNSLATVCDIELVSSQPRSFKNCENGRAELRNGVWEVTKKLKLQYV